MSDQKAVAKEGSILDVTYNGGKVHTIFLGSPQDLSPILAEKGVRAMRLDTHVAKGAIGKGSGDEYLAFIPGMGTYNVDVKRIHA